MLATWFVGVLKMSYFKAILLATWAEMFYNSLDKKENEEENNNIKWILQLENVFLKHLYRKHIVKII